jgi:hypothetical protein
LELARHLLALLVALVDQVVVLVAAEQQPAVLETHLAQVHHKVITEEAEIIRAAVAVELVLLVVMLLHLLLVQVDQEATVKHQLLLGHLLHTLAVAVVLVELQAQVVLEAAGMVLQTLLPEHLAQLTQAVVAAGGQAQQLAVAAVPA